MGMFDQINCEYPLPGDAPPADMRGDFQTKDLDNMLDTYTITSDGRLEGGRPNFTGDLEFYTNNVVASDGAIGYLTRNGDDARFWTYKATFVDGRLTKLEETENLTEPAVAFDKVDFFPKKRPEEQEEMNRRMERKFSGETLCVSWGVSPDEMPKPYLVKVIAENERELVVQKEDGSFEIIHRIQYGRMLFDSEEHAQEGYLQRQRELAERKAQFAAALAEKRALKG